MVEEFFISKMVSHNTMVSGEMTYLMAGVLCILKLELGKNMRENLGMESKKAEEECTLQMALYTMENFEEIKYPAEEEGSVLMAKFHRSIGIQLALNYFLDHPNF